ncbi:hypothetical protein PRIPAC_85916 [Pristionchus pacificus]|uniref:BAR domain-containing protein n=1 Tax=Pristionchus pacificus TaxID=54126 RepID=A0A2A6BKS6_PRIPA|nr:hypothetical protein PRIPAC_85916 [Pristionchus pacificus]|eukprot:PDM66391.1 hypothetical protein PRIPAC_47808 [Pristionchus pacificus]
MFRRMKQNLAEKVGRATVTTSLPAEVDKGIKQVEVWKKRHGEMHKDYEAVRRISNPSKHDDVANLISKLGANLAGTEAATGKAGSTDASTGTWAGIVANNIQRATDLERACTKMEQKVAELIQKEWGATMKEFDKKNLKEMQDCITAVNRTRLDKDGTASALQSKDTASRRERSTAAEATYNAQIEAARALFATIPTLEAEQAANLLATVNKHGGIYGEAAPASM